MRRFLVTGLGTGYLPVAPGTWASAAAVAVFLAAACLWRGSGVAIDVVMLAVLVCSSVGCLALGGFAESAFGRKDPRQCTIDEWAGQAAALVFLPVGAWGWRLGVVAASSFVAFRLLDIIKPPPARRLQRLPRGWGILLDDLVAGLYANVICQVVFRLWLRW